MGRPRREAGAVGRSVASRSAGSATSPPPGGSRVNAVLNCVVTWAGAMTGKPEEEDVSYIAGDSFRAQQLRLLKGFSHMWRRTATLVLIYLTPMGQASPLHFGSGDDVSVELFQGLPLLTEDDLDDLDDAPDTELEETEERVVDQASAARTIAELEVEITMLARLEE